MFLLSLFFISTGVFLIWNSYNNIKYNHEVEKVFALFKGSVGLMSTVIGFFSIINFFL